MLGAMKTHHLLVLAFIYTVVSAAEPAKPSSPEAGRLALKVLSERELSAFLSQRVEAGLDGSFGEFANKFMVFSSMSAGKAVGLETKDAKVAEARLSPVFPGFYRPTLAQLFDMIAMQSRSSWSYVKENQFALSDSPAKGKPDDNLIIITFKANPSIVVTRRAYSIKLAEGWKRNDRGHWEMLVPPKVRVGMDIYDMGRYSAETPFEQDELMKRVRLEVSQDWAAQIGKKLAAADFQTVKVGKFEALHFDAMIPSRLNKDVHWRQWVLTVGDRCFFIVSTLFPDQEKDILPDVNAMLASFELEAN